MWKRSFSLRAVLISSSHQVIKTGVQLTSTTTYYASVNYGIIATAAAATAADSIFVLLTGGFFIVLRRSCRQQQNFQVQDKIVFFRRGAGAGKGQSSTFHFHLKRFSANALKDKRARIHKWSHHTLDRVPLSPSLAGSTILFRQRALDSAEKT